MQRYFLHIEDGRPLLDSTGTLLPDMAALRKEVLGVTAELMANGLRGRAGMGHRGGYGLPIKPMVRA